MGNDIQPGETQFAAFTQWSTAFSQPKDSRNSEAHLSGDGYPKHRTRLVSSVGGS